MVLRKAFWGVPCSCIPSYKISQCQSCFFIFSKHQVTKERISFRQVLFCHFEVQILIPFSVSHCAGQTSWRIRNCVHWWNHVILCTWDASIFEPCMSDNYDWCCPYSVRGQIQANCLTKAFSVVLKALQQNFEIRLSWE